MTQVNRHEEVYYEDVVMHEDEGVADIPPRKMHQIVWLIAIIVEVLIAFRVFLKMIAANPESGFASFVYSITTPILAPFAGLTTTPSANGAVFELSSLIAMIVYAIFFGLASYVIRVLWER